MKRMCFYIATLALIAVSAQSATTVFFDDFDTYRNSGDTTNTVLSVKKILPKIWYDGDDPIITAVVDNPLSWYVGSAWGTLLGATNGAPTATTRNRIAHE